jgi:hypothetical protein
MSRPVGAPACTLHTLGYAPYEGETPHYDATSLFLVAQRYWPGETLMPRVLDANRQALVPASPHPMEQSSAALVLFLSP